MGWEAGFVSYFLILCHRLTQRRRGVCSSLVREKRSDSSGDGCVGFCSHILALRSGAPGEEIDTSGIF